MANKWTEIEIALLRKYYPDNTTRFCTTVINRKYSGISHKAMQLGITKSDAFFNSEASCRLNGKKDNGSRFEKGHVSYNKGKKMKEYMTPEQIEKVSKTFFKKGSIPHNTVAIGHERITKDGYIEVKVSNGGNTKNFILKQRYVYEQNYGPIPENMIVKFKDGNALNVVPDNLYISTRLDNLMANSFSDKSIAKRLLGIKDTDQVEKIINEMPELIELKRKTVLLNLKIKKLCKVD